MILTWQMNAPTFTTDLDIYIWEQYKALPTFRQAEIRLFSQSGTDEKTLMILFRHSSSLHLFAELRDNAEQLSKATPAAGVQVWSPISEAIFSICATFQVMILETTRFLQGCSMELDKMVSRPSFL
jgi:hypothetical protein